REYTMLYPNPAGNDGQRPPEWDFVKGDERDLLIRGLTHGHDTAGGYPLRTAQLKVDAEPGMSVGEGRNPDAGSNAAQVIHHFGTGQTLDLIAQDQEVDAGEHRAVSHGRAPLNTGGAEEKRSIPPPDWRRNSDLPAEAGRSAAAAWVAGISSSCPP